MSRIDYLTRIQFGDYLLDDALGIEIYGLGIRRPLVVADSEVAEAGLLDTLLDACPGFTSPVAFTDTRNGPDEKVCTLAAEVFRENECDSVIGLGGGMSIDLAKIVALLVSHDKPLSHYVVTEGGANRIRDVLPPVIAIPTVTGTGSEVSHTASMTASGGQRQILVSEYLIPRVAICDPTLTTTVSPQLTAAAGMDALTHCIETYLALSFNPPADGIAIDGLQRVAENIETAVTSGSNLSARRELMAAAINGALALQKGLGSVHAMSNALESSAAAVSAGALKSVLLPRVLEFNEPAVRHRYQALKRALGVTQKQSIVDGVKQLSKRIGLPSTLRELGIGAGDVERSAMFAELDHNNRTNPRRATVSDYRLMIGSAL